MFDQSLGRSKKSRPEIVAELKAKAAELITLSREDDPVTCAELVRWAREFQPSVVIDAYVCLGNGDPVLLIALVDGELRRIWVKPSSAGP